MLNTKFQRSLQFYYPDSPHVQTVPTVSSFSIFPSVEIELQARNDAGLKHDWNRFGVWGALSWEGEPVSRREEV